MTIHFIILPPHILSDTKLPHMSMYKGDLGLLPSSIGPFVNQWQPQAQATMSGSQVVVQENAENLDLAIRETHFESCFKHFV